MLERSRFEHELEDLFSGSHPTAELEVGAGLNSFGEAGGGRISRNNRKDPLASEIVKVEGRWKEIPLHRKAAEAHRKMVEAARADGIAYPLLLPTSGYRPVSKRRMQAWKDAIKRYGSVEEARKWVAPPSTSPHRTGRAIDHWMGSSNDSSNASKQKRTKAYLWLKNNAQRFGFYNYWREPWHWEYNPTAAQERSGGAVTGLIHSGLDFLTDMLNKGLIAGSVFRMIQRGNRDEDKLTDELFFFRHPERNRRPIQKGERDAMQEWRNIRDQIIRPLLERLQATAPLSAAGAARPANSSPENTGPDWLRGMLKKGSISLRVFTALMGGERNENKLTDVLFHDRHPERKGRSIHPSEEAAGEEWRAIRDNIVRPILKKGFSVSKVQSTSNSFSQGKVPEGFKVVHRGKPKRPKGLSRYATERLDEVLIRLRNRGKINATNDEIDLFQRIANVETGGKIQGINTWDSAVVSSGFMQWTLQHGKLQDWIELAPGPYRKYGIELDGSQKYLWTRRDKKTGKMTKNYQTAIKGEPDKNDLRWGDWAEKFYRAGLDPDIIAREVELAREHLQRHLNGMKGYFERKKMAGGFEKFLQYYNASAYVRGMFQAAYNNLPRAAQIGTLHAISKSGLSTSLNDFIGQYKKSLPYGYQQQKDPEGAGRIISETKDGARF